MKGILLVLRAGVLAVTHHHSHNKIRHSKNQVADAESQSKNDGRHVFSVDGKKQQCHARWKRHQQNDQRCGNAKIIKCPADEVKKHTDNRQNNYR